MTTIISAMQQPSRGGTASIRAVSALSAKMNPHIELIPAVSVTLPEGLQLSVH
jgi:hypothetical protein